MNFKLLGVLLISGIAAEESSSLEELGEETLQPYKRSAIRSADTYDTTEVITVNAPLYSSSWGHQRCWNSGVFAIVSAIEISHTLITGTVRKFSEQELIDCFYRGCLPTSAAWIVRWLMVNDRLAPSNNYTPYLAQNDICRSAFAPDGLDEVEIADVFSVSPNTIEDAIRVYGSVTACLHLSEENCPMYHTYVSGVIDGPSIYSCNHVVNIVGYTEDSYKIKDHRGPDWGEGGYFHIKRGGNACGVEHKMIAIAVRKREVKKELAPNGCPLSAPVYCEELKTCTTEAEPCVEGTKSKAKRSASKCADYPNYPCHKVLNLCNRVPQITQRCEKSCNKCKVEDEYTGSCVNDPKTNCDKQNVARLCKYSRTMRIKCPRTCKVPDSECTKESQKIHPEDKRPRSIKGQCYVPDIANGKVDGADEDGMLESGAELKVSCYRGYVKIGKPNHCGLQKVYGPDSRLMQSCVKVNSEAFTSNGYDYEGMATIPVRMSPMIPCDNWNELIFRGKFLHITEDVATARALMYGNHNFCRNSADMQQPVPFCIVGTNKLAYCKSYPGCDVCEAGVEDKDRYCESSPTRCPYTTEYKLNANNDAWTYCKRSCCALAECV